MNKDSCILQKMASAISHDPSLRAVWLDAENKKVSFAFTPGANPEETKKNLQHLVSEHQPGEIPDCAQDSWRVVCEVCERGLKQPLPPGVRLVSMPGAGVMLERESCATAARLWKWDAFKWVKFTTRELPKLGENENPEEWKDALLLAIICGVSTVVGALLHKYLPVEYQWVSLLVYACAYITGAWHPAEEVLELLQKRMLDVHFLMLCVAAGAAIIGHYWEGSVLLFLFSFSGALEHYSMARTEREIKSLFKEAPKEATVIENGAEKKYPVEEIKPNMTLRVRPGEQFPVDAIVVSGSSAANESSLTGESAPVDKSVGNAVYSGTMNIWGSIECRVTKSVNESSLAKIINLIKTAQESKAPTQRFTDKFGTGYTYIILGISIAMFLFWWLILGIPAFVAPEGQSSAFYRAMTLLVVASPCALVLSIPSAILAGIASGARRGVLFRGGVAIEKLSEINRVALDKTGTLTTGELQVVKIESFPSGKEKELAQIAAALGHHSSHPVSRAIAKYVTESGDAIHAVETFKSITGLGLEGTIKLGEQSEREIKMGRRSLFENANWLDQVPLPEIGVTEVIIQSGDLSGRILLRDEVRESSAPLLKKLRDQGIKITMLTGDREEAAQLVASHLGDIEVKSGLHPEDKVAAIQSWTQKGEKVAMVGDGVNDAPSLAAAHVAVGMGVRGSDSVLEQADVILMQDKLENFNFAYNLSRKAKKIIWQNLVISLGVICVMVICALCSFIPLTVGVIAHEGSTVIVVLNSLRLLVGNKQSLS